MLIKPPPYEELIERHGLSVIAKGGDLVLTPDGDLAMTSDGDLQFGSTAHNGMFRLASAWRYNSPTMRLMFDTVRELRDAHSAREREVNDALTPVLWNGRPLETDYSAYHAANDALGAGTLGRGALAGSLMLVTASLLDRFRKDVGPTDPEWDATPPLQGAYSVGQSVIAAANSFRHMDEWRRSSVAGAFRKQQSNSITVLVGALGLTSATGLFGDINPSERLISQIAETDFEQFEGAVLRYANGVAAQVEIRSKPPRAPA